MLGQPKLFSPGVQEPDTHQARERLTAHRISANTLLIRATRIIKYEGKSNDVHENKGPEETLVGKSHDVDENKGTYFRYPTIFMKIEELHEVLGPVDRRLRWCLKNEATVWEGKGDRRR